MVRRPLVEPFKNITNRQIIKKQPLLTETEVEILEVHKQSEKNEICAMSKYYQAIMGHYERFDGAIIFKERDITFEMRSLLADWMISCHEKLDLCDDTLHLSIYLIDRFLSDRQISPNKLQLVGITALFIASKYEEVSCPDINSFLLLSDRTFDQNDLKKAEKFMLYSIDYRLDYVNPLNFLRRVSKANNYEAKSRKMAKYFLELMCLYKDFSGFSRNILCTTAMYMARKILQVDYNKNLFFYYSKLERSEMRQCFDALVRLIYSDIKYENLENKYNKESMFKVASIAREYARLNFK